MLTYVTILQFSTCNDIIIIIILFCQVSVSEANNSVWWNNTTSSKATPPLLRYNTVWAISVCMHVCVIVCEQLKCYMSLFLIFLMDLRNVSVDTKTD